LIPGDVCAVGLVSKDTFSAAAHYRRLHGALQRKPRAIESPAFPEKTAEFRIIAGLNALKGDRILSKRVSAFVGS
jgi:hypothetical protein